MIFHEKKMREKQFELFCSHFLNFYFVDLWAVPDSEKCAIPLIS